MPRHHGGLFDAAAAMPVHGTEVGIGHDHLVAERLEMLRHPFTLGRGFDQNPHPRPTPEHRRQAIPSRRNPAVGDRSALGHDSNLTLVLVQVDGTIFHGWCSPCASRARFSSVERKLPPHRGDQPLHPIYGLDPAGCLRVAELTEKGHRVRR